MSVPAGARVLGRVAGGYINEAVKVELADGTLAFVKSRSDAVPGEYRSEAQGLRWLAEPGAVRTPEVIEVADGHLALEWIDVGQLSGAGEEELGRGLAATHLSGAACFGIASGSAGSFGSLRLPNEPAADWPTFYAERRLGPLARMAAERAVLDGAALSGLERVCERIGELVGPSEPPSRIHGDLWSGNVIGDAGGRPWLIDPSAYGGHSEVDLAMLRLFGGPGPRMFSAYEEVAPLAEGWQERVALYQLLPLLVHALLFGGSYAAAASRAVQRVVA